MKAAGVFSGPARFDPADLDYATKAARVALELGRTEFWAGGVRFVWKPLDITLSFEDRITANLFTLRRQLDTFKVDLENERAVRSEPLPSKEPARVTLDEAWKEAEAALPVKGRIALQRRPDQGQYEAWAQSDGGSGSI